MTPLLGNRSKGLFFILSAPAGTGKTTLVELLKNEFPQVVSSISFTTRSPRKDEINGRDYHFVDEETFKAKLIAQDFIEYVNLYGTYYGTCKRWIFEQQEKGKHVFLVIDTQGAEQIRKQLEVITTFVKPPSLEELKDRLVKRQTDSEVEIQKRLERAVFELQEADSYDYEIVNDDLSTAYQKLRSILIAECNRNRIQQIVE